MTEYCKKTYIVSPFQGNGELRTEKREGISSSWYIFKGRCGNTHPGAQLPFGKYSVCAYSGGYSTGYGNNRLNSGEPVKALYDCKKIFGLTHQHHSGAGNMGYFYNYALTSVFFGELRVPDMNDIVDEISHPGYYSATAKQSEIRYEGTISEKAVYHRYTLPQIGGRVMIDFSNDGLYDNIEEYVSNPAAKLEFDAGDAAFTVIDEHTVCASVVLQGLTLHFCVYSSGKNATLWENYKELTQKELKTSGESGRKFGCVFELDGNIGETCLTISLRSADKALADNIAARNADFDETVRAADAIWEKRLSAIEIKTDKRNEEIFYSNLYHSLTKPSDWMGESPYYDENDFLVDISTFWDIYKTQVPLLDTLYQDISKKLIRTYAYLNREIGVMPNAFGLTRRINAESNQARLLASYLFCDAYYRGVPDIDYEWAFKTLANEMRSEQYREFFQNGRCEKTTHTLDIAECCGNVSDIAKELALDEISNEFEPYSHNWRSAFDKETGLLHEDAAYYEGNHWNYSFRPMREMKERIDEYGGCERFEALLDRFFGYTHPESIDTRFEAFNNETDMETPYAYAYAERHDKLCEVVHLGTKCMFTTGEGGVPGNADSGGLTACYIWNALGIFPVAGQDIMIIGTPYFEESKLNLSSGKTFTIKRQGEGIYVKSATLDGEHLNMLRISVRRMMQGGELVLDMTDRSEEAMRK